MKKAYSAPEIAFQSLNATAVNSTPCEYLEIRNLAPNSCPLKDKTTGMTVFTTECGDFAFTPEGNVCYGLPTDDLNVHNS